jgi:hypothetical protein
VGFVLIAGLAMLSWPTVLLVQLTLLLVSSRVVRSVQIVGLTLAISEEAVSTCSFFHIEPSLLDAQHNR